MESEGCSELPLLQVTEAGTVFVFQVYIEILDTLWRKYLYLQQEHLQAFFMELDVLVFVG